MHAYRTLALLVACLALVSLAQAGPKRGRGNRGLEATQPAVASGLPKRYRAVLFAAQDYARDSGMQDLRTPVEDTRRLGRLLEEQYGFEAEVVENASQSDIVGRLDRLKAETGDDDAVLIYYAGHGVYDAEEDVGYWLPVDASAHDSARWVSNDSVAAKLRAMRARHVLLVSDSCFSGKFRAVSLPSGAATLDADAASKLAKNRSRWVITSGGNEPVADGGRDGMSVFAYYFHSALERATGAYVAPDNFFPQLRAGVQRNSEQTPQQGESRGAFHEGGQFVLTNNRACSEGVGDRVAAVQTSARTAWARDVKPRLDARDTRTVKALEAWLARWAGDVTVEACGKKVPVTVDHVAEARTLHDLMTQQPAAQPAPAPAPAPAAAAAPRPLPAKPRVAAPPSQGANAMFGKAERVWAQANEIASFETLRASQAQQQCYASFFMACDQTATLPNLEALRPVLQNAIRFYGEAIDAHPNNTRAKQAWLNIAQGWMVLGQQAKTVASLNAFVQRYPHSAEAADAQGVLMLIEAAGAGGRLPGNLGAIFDTGVTDTGQ